MTGGTARTAHFDVLDGWRGISIVLILVCHLLPVGLHSWQLNAPVGAVGMALFFCLSGFLITSMLLKGITVRDFLIRRLCRIVPLAWLGLIFGLFVLGAPMRDIVPGFLFYANVPPYYLTPATAHYWSLGLEVQFYAAVALLYGLAGRRALLLLPLAAIAVTTLRVRQHVPIAIYTPYRIDEILSGCILALAYSGELGSRVRAAFGRINPFVWAVALLLSADPRTGFMAYLRPYFAAALVGRTLIGTETALHRPLRSRPLAYLATISYALYVIHGLLSNTWLGSGDKLIKYAKRPLLLAVTFALAHLSTFHFESRWIAFGKRLSETPRHPASSSAAASPGHRNRNQTGNDGGVAPRSGTAVTSSPAVTCLRSAGRGRGCPHRLFSEVSKNWQGVPLETYQVALNYISTTTTTTGLTVSAKINSKIYATGQSVTDQEMQLLNIRMHRSMPEWCYTIKPYAQKQLRKM